MAINHNFKEGIDWAADATGETPLANHLFVSEDSTSTEDGSPQNPYNTVELAIDNAIAGDTIIVGTGLYTINTYANFNKSTIFIKGDGYVLWNGNGNDLFELVSNARVQIYNIRLLNYNNLNYSVTNNNSIFYLNNCFLLSSNYEQPYVAGAVFVEDCTLIESNILAINATATGTVNEPSSKLKFGALSDEIYSMYNCIFINSEYRHSKGFANCYFDSDSFVNFPSDTSQSVSFLETNFNNIRCSIQIVSTTYATLEQQKTADSRINQNSIDVTPGFNSEINYVFSLSPTSQMISKGENGSNITGRFVGDGYYRGVTDMDSAVDANSNIEYNSINEIVIGAGGGSSEVLGEIVKAYDDLTIAGQIDIAGFLDMINMIPDSDNTLVNPNNLILEMAFAGVDEVYTAYKKYRWDEIPTNNTDGTSNGQSTYNWNENNRIICQFIKVRVTILNDGIYNRS